MIKIAIIGPESTGKSTLAKKLAEHYSTEWIPEYARQYIEKLPNPYTYEDICNIAKIQIEQENFQTKNSNCCRNYIFFDTELIITKVWFEHKYGKSPTFLNEHLQKGFFDYYLLCAPDMPWIADSVRENGGKREFFFNWYKNEIEKLNKPYSIITGLDDDRIKNALNILDNYNLK